MAMKKIINKRNNCVNETLMGLSIVYPQLNYYDSRKIIFAANWDNRKDKVAIISGGGAGHEPFAGGFVGSGALTAAISGTIFAAPPPNNILYALEKVSTQSGILVIIPNYTGDCLNFGIAIEKAKQKGFKIVDVVVEDDCSIPQEDQGRAGKRGLVGILFYIKILGALAEQGSSLDILSHHAKIIGDNLATYGVGLEPCSLPGQGPMFDLPNDEIEIGLGVHGEAGYERIKIISAENIIEIILNKIIKSLSLIKNDSVVVIINNFGGTSQLEQGIAVYEVISQLKKKGYKVLRVYSSTLMSSLNASGIHISILKLLKHTENLYINCLDDKTDAPCWPGCNYSVPTSNNSNIFIENDDKILPNGKKFNDEQTNLMKICLQNICKSLIDNEITLNNLDRGCGDGDCGTTHRNLAEGILSSFNDLHLSHPSSLLFQLAEIAEKCMGGTSGAIYSLMLTTAASVLNNFDDDNWTKLWAKAFSHGINGVMKYSRAKPGDRTMLDALIPASESFNKYENYIEAITKALESARIGCNDTKKMIPKAGRAAYVKQSKYLTEVDAGAFGVVVWINAIYEILLNFDKNL